MVLVSLKGKQNGGEETGKGRERRGGKGKRREERMDNKKLMRYHHIYSLGERMLETVAIPCRRSCYAK